MSDPLVSSALGYFLKVAELGSFTAAARALHISQPSLSVAVRKLEEELGTRLLTRTRKGIHLTRTGEVLMHHGTHAGRTLAAAREEIHGLQTEPRGRFTVGCHESLGAYFLPGFMGRFISAHPGIEVGLWNGNSREVQRAVVDRQLDAGLVVNALQHPDCVVTTLFQDRVELIASAQLCNEAGRNPSSLFATHPLIHVPVLAQVQYILGALAKAGVRPARPIPCSSMELVKSLVLDGVGVGILPHRVATYGVASGRLATLSASLPSFDDSISLVRRFDMHLTKAARLLLDGLRDHGKSMEPVPGAGARRKGAR